MGTRLEELIEEEGGFLSNREIGILLVKEKKNAGKQSTETDGAFTKDRTKRKKRIRKDSFD